LTPPRFDALLVTCEHAGNAVGSRAAAFRGQPDVLRTHRAWDPGAAVLARELAAACHAPLHEGQFTRLLIDLNRRENSKAVFSSYTPLDARGQLLEFHRNWRAAVLADALRLSRRGRLLHVSCHSFTPEMHGEVRNAEIGLLYDPRRALEKRTADAWHAALREALPGARVRRNYPYKGISDGVTSWLRRELPATRYAGFELELNQSFAAKPAREWKATREAVISVVHKSLG
jgi:predicted N-formylglutamate amidohydrolase